jgi:phosphatidate cytidylyltransferase
MLRQRLLVAAVGLPLLLVLTALGGVAFAAALAIVLAAGALELCAAAGLPLRRPEVPAVAAIAAGFVPAAYGHADIAGALIVLAIALPLVAAVVRLERYGDDEPPQALPAWLVLPLAALYVGWLGHYLLGVRRFPNGARWFLVLLLGTFAADTGAYTAGRLFGQHRLAPRVSPAKTVEGAAGGLIAALVATAALATLLELPGDPALTALLGLCLGSAAEAGDLVESLIKRRLGVKDMSHVLPGHGGVLDRLDSLLLAGPVVYFFVRWIILR